ncbi:MAG: flippase-like domain-containing protein [Nitrospinaceae bacterium]
MKTGKVLLFFLGLGIIALLFYKIGFTEIEKQFSDLGWKVLYIFLPFFLIGYIGTWAWIYTFPPPFSKYKISFSKLFWLRVVGEAVNNFTSTAHVGGDLTRVLFLKKLGVPTTKGMVAVIMDKVALIITEVFFIFTGILLLLVKMDWPAWVKGGVASSFLLAGLFIYGILLMVRKGVFSKMSGSLQRRWDWKWLDQIHEKIKHLDHHLSHFYRHHRREFISSNVLHYVSWILGALETWTILYVLGLRVGLVDAIMIEALVTLVKGLGFFIVGSLGVLEGGTVFLFQILNIGEGTGLAFTLLKRAREMAFGALSWLVFSIQLAGLKPRGTQTLPS